MHESRSRGMNFPLNPALSAYRLNQAFRYPENCASADTAEKQLVGFDRELIDADDWNADKTETIIHKAKALRDELIWFMLRAMQIESYVQIMRSNGRVYFIDPFGFSPLRTRVLVRMDPLSLFVLPYNRYDRRRVSIVPHGSYKPNGRLPSRLDELCDPLADALGLLKTLEASNPSQSTSLLSALNLGQSINSLHINLRFAGHIRMPGLRAVSSKAEKMYQEAVTVYQNCRYAYLLEGYDTKEAALFKAASKLNCKPETLKSRLSKGRKKYGVWPVNVDTGDNP